MNRFPFFYAWHGRWIGSDWLYKIYVTPAALYGAVIDTQFPAPPSQSSSTQIEPAQPSHWLSQLIKPLDYNRMADRQTLETLYDAMEPHTLELLTTDERNFCFVNEQIREIRLNQRLHWWSLPVRNSGTLEIHLHHKNKLWFFLPGQQDTAHIADLIRSVTAKVKLVK